MLVSSCPGRVRFRDAKLRDAGFSAELAGRVEALDGVVAVCGNARSGSLLVVYDPGVLPKERILAEAESVAAEGPAALGDLKAWFASRRGRATVKAGMAASVAGAVVALALSERVHAVLGASFVLFATAHLTQNRRTLFR
jgi:hypothetical protein